MFWVILSTFTLCYTWRHRQSGSLKPRTRNLLTCEVLLYLGVCVLKRRLRTDYFNWNVWIDESFWCQGCGGTMLLLRRCWLRINSLSPLLLILFTFGVCYKTHLLPGILMELGGGRVVKVWGWKICGWYVSLAMYVKYVFLIINCKVTGSILDMNLIWIEWIYLQTILLYFIDLNIVNSH